MAYVPVLAQPDIADRDPGRGVRHAGRDVALERDREREHCAPIRLLAVCAVLAVRRVRRRSAVAVPRKLSQHGACAVPPAVAPAPSQLRRGRGRRVPPLATGRPPRDLRRPPDAASRAQAMPLGVDKAHRGSRVRYTVGRGRGAPLDADKAH
jgi:hypothetical protein